HRAGSHGPANERGPDDSHRGQGGVQPGRVHHRGPAGSRAALGEASMAKILIIEDNPANMKLACLLLGKGGHSVLTAIDAEAGLAVARAESPELILMDIQLPGMDGLTATELLKG